MPILLARVPVRADGRYCDKRCQFYWDSRPNAGYFVYCELTKYLRKSGCTVLRVRDGRAVRCAACVRACKEQT
ncbi:MAG TPA: hypothetical protein DEB56_14780 [Thiobacillus sp.]|nr:hypothetical protein [Thiobacillus sp.]